MAQNDIHRVKINAQYLGQQALNVLHFVQLTQDPVLGLASAALARAIDDVILPAWVDLLSDQYQIQSVEVLNLDDFQDYTLDTNITNNVGQETGQPVPSNVCFTFRKARPVPAFRNGYLRLAGVTEPTINGNALASTMSVKAGALSAALGLDIADPNDPTIEFRGGYLATNRGVTPTRVEFVVPTSNAFLRIGSQNTRKPGSGI